MNTDQRIKAKCLELGFSAARIARVEEAAHAREYADWLEEGRHGEMAYMGKDPERREDPSRLFPGALSAVVVAMPQPVGPPGPISRYARSEDYHDAMWARLNALLAFVKTLHPGANGRGYVDTAPILERDLAAAGGLGWIGKNTCLITPGVGSFYFLGELLLDVELEPDPPIGQHCGSCRRCLDACPTGAFVGPYVLDARRCISYLTIELKGSIPEELRPLIGNMVFGCDICQDVCPHNKWAPAASPLQARHDLDAPDLIDFLSMDEAAFRERFRGTPILRAKRRGFLRNVCVALGNLRDVRAVPALERAKSDPEPLVREHAAWALHCIAGR
ncbi:MAG TPA: tRNA epoxyqueuosine(34) reductase QueG [Armatimonadota bacterium]|jgi:epoxyqueuosine reductase